METGTSLTRVSSVVTYEGQLKGIGNVPTVITVSVAAQRHAICR